MQVRIAEHELLATDVRVLAIAGRAASGRDVDYKRFDAYCSELDERLRAALAEALAGIELGEGVRLELV